MYFVDASNSGSIYKYKPAFPNDLFAGQTSVLKVTGFTGSSALDWNASPGTSRVGAAKWVTITDNVGVKTTTVNPFEFNPTVGLGGRAAADEVSGTPYGRPQDIVISTDKDGKQVLYFAATSENTVYVITLLDEMNASVKVFCNQDTLNIATGARVGTDFVAPNNLAIDFDGSIYVVEDQATPNSDIWQVVDTNKDGVADHVALWLSNGVAGSEPTGLMFHPNDLTTAIVAVHDPTSKNDALFEVKFSPPPPVQNIPILVSNTALKNSKATLPTGGVGESSAPFDVTTGFTYRKITDRQVLNNPPGTLPLGFKNFDMITYAAPENSKPGFFPDAEKSIFIPMEADGGGLLRYNTIDGSSLILARGIPGKVRNSNPLSFDPANDNFVEINPATYTPLNTVLFAEGATGK